MAVLEPPEAPETPEATPKAEKPALAARLPEPAGSLDLAEPTAPAVLLLGEANFSFAAALAALLARAPDGRGLVAGADADGPGAEAARPAETYLGWPLATCRRARLVASCFEGQELRVEKYPESEGFLRQFVADRAGQAEVRHGVNGWDLRSSFAEGERWDRIAWNHPHLGTEDFKLHRFLLAHFFHAAVRDLQPQGRVVLSLVEGQADRWDLLRQAERQGLVLVAGPQPFVAQEWPGYECKRNTTGKSFKNLHAQRHAAAAMRSWSYHFGLRGERPPRPAPPPAAAAVAAAAAGAAGAAGAARAARADRAARAPPAPAGDADPTSCRPAARHSCDECGKAFSCAQGLRTHQRQVHELRKYGSEWRPSSGLVQRCPHCGRGFGDAEALWQHVLAAHGGGSSASAAAAPAAAAPPPAEASGAAGASTAAPAAAPAAALPAGDSLPPGQAAGATAAAALPRGARGPSLVMGPMPAAASEATCKGGGGFRACEVCGMAVPRGMAMETHLDALKPVVGLSLRCELCGKAFVEQRALGQHMRFCAARAAAAAGARPGPAAGAGAGAGAGSAAADAAAGAAAGAAAPAAAPDAPTVPGASAPPGAPAPPAAAPSAAPAAPVAHAARALRPAASGWCWEACWAAWRPAARRGPARRGAGPAA